jgi:cardiolipin synthase
MSLTDPILWEHLYVLSGWVIRVVMLMVVPFRRTPDAARGWLLFIFVLPWIGLLTYLAIGRPRLPRSRMERSVRGHNALAPTIKRLRAHPNVLHPAVGPELQPAVRLAQNLGNMPILGGNDAELLPDYDGVFARLIADIDASRQHVHLLFYIYFDDRVTRPVTEALERAVRRGVACRVLVDALGSCHGMRKLLARLRAAGVQAHEMLKINLVQFWRSRLDLRNHRKIAVIDGRVAYTGSQNLVDAHFKPSVVYEELVVRVTGPLVLELQYLFAADWHAETEETLDGPEVFPEPAVTGAVAAQVLPSGPGFPTENNQRFVVALIHGARERVVVTTPYLIPDVALFQALQTAVLRGVEVHLVMSKRHEQWIVYLAQNSYYEELLEAGVTIHLYREKFLHAKHLSIDGEVALIGTSNMDLRSFRLNAEVMVAFCDRGVVARLRAEQERYIRGSETLTAAAWRKRPFARKVVENVARLFDSLL